MTASRFLGLLRTMFWVGVLTILAMAMLVVLQSPAYAADDQVVVDDTSLHQVQVFSLLVGVILPIVVGLVTTRVTSESTKAVLLAALSAVSGFLTEIINVGGFDGFDWWAAILTTLTTFVVAVATHFGFWKPTGVSDTAQRSLVKERGHVTPAR